MLRCSLSEFGFSAEQNWKQEIFSPKNDPQCKSEGAGNELWNECNKGLLSRLPCRPLSVIF